MLNSVAVVSVVYQPIKPFTWCPESTKHFKLMSPTVHNKRERREHQMLLNHDLNVCRKSQVLNANNSSTLVYTVMPRGGMMGSDVM